MVTEKGRPGGLSFGALRITALENMCAKRDKIELHRVNVSLRVAHKSWKLEYFCHLTTEISGCSASGYLQWKILCTGLKNKGVKKKQKTNIQVNFHG